MEQPIVKQKMPSHSATVPRIVKLRDAEQNEGCQGPREEKLVLRGRVSVWEDEKVLEVDIQQYNCAQYH